jgi:excisionase family DNA binding protein
MLEVGECYALYLGPSQTPSVLTATEAGEYLKMHTKTVCRLARDGNIPAKKVGKEWRFLRSVLDRWQAEQTQV